MPEESSLRKRSSSERAELYSQVLESGDRKRLAQLVRTLYLRQKHLIAKGRHLHSLDERFLKNAENLLFDEFSAVLAYPKTKFSTYRNPPKQSLNIYKWHK